MLRRGSHLSDIELTSKLKQLLCEGRRVVLCTLIEKTGSGPRNIGAKMLVDSYGRTHGTIGGGGMERRLVNEALAALKEGKPRTLIFALGVEAKTGVIPVDSKCGGEVKIFLDVIKPDPRLIILGSGHIAKPLAEFAYKTGFTIVVVDDAKTATHARFPMAKIHVGPLEDEIDKVEIRPSDFVAIVDGEADYELTALRSVIRKTPAYIGLLGSRNKASGHREQLLLDGFKRTQVEAIHAPIGLNIGAETPEEIALSIVAELIQIKRN